MTALATLQAHLRPGVELTVVTDGKDADLVDWIEALADLAESTRVDVLTWIASPEHVARAATLGDVRFLFGSGPFLHDQVRAAATVAATGGPHRWRVTHNHIKGAIVRGRHGDWLLRSSANLNPNPRSELVEITDDPGSIDALASVVDALFEAELHPVPTQAKLDDIRAAGIPWEQRRGVVAVGAR